MTTDGPASPEPARPADPAGSDDPSGSPGPAGPVLAAPGQPGPSGPPPGPGVQPPFAAPPIDGDRTRVWVGLGVGAVALVLCCLGGLAGLGGLIYTGTQAIDEQSRVTVDRYLGALVKKDYRDAYSMLCDSAQQGESEAAFTTRLSQGPQVESYQIGKPETTNIPVTVPADVQYDTGVRRNLRFALKQDSKTAEFEVCGVQ